MEQIRAIIVDDEPLARIGLKRLLAGFTHIQVVGEAGRVPEARKLFEETPCDLVFLDVQLFGGNGFDLLPFLPSTCQVIFVTAYDEFALRAFEVNALDYLLKPVKPTRLAEALRRIQHQAGAAPTEPAPPTGKLRSDDSVLLTEDSRKRLIAVKNIRAITADGEYSEIHPEGSPSGLLRKSMKSWEEDLPADRFIRIHRNAIVNFDFIEHFERQEGGKFVIRVKGFPTPFESSRRLSSEFSRRISERPGHDRGECVAN
jgi:two-component system LytT family response regulator